MWLQHVPGACGWGIWLGRRLDHSSKPGNPGGSSDGVRVTSLVVGGPEVVDGRGVTPASPSGVVVVSELLGVLVVDLGADLDGGALERRGAGWTASATRSASLHRSTALRCMPIVPA